MVLEDDAGEVGALPRWLDTNIVEITSTKTALQVRDVPLKYCIRQYSPLEMKLSVNRAAIGKREKCCLIAPSRFVPATYR